MMKLKEASRKQAEKKKLEEQLRKQEAEAAKSPETTFQTPLRPVRSVAGTPLGTPKFSFSPKTLGTEANKTKFKQSEKKRLEEQIRQQEAAEEAAAEAAV